MPLNWPSIFAIAISAIALIVAILNYRRKSGIALRGDYIITSSRTCEDRYISEIALENLKDKSVPIYDIYLQVGYSIYIHIESFENSPLILKPFEVYQKQFGPIEFYGFNMRRVEVNKLLIDNMVRKRLVLSTADGKYIVPRFMKTWSPIGDYFNNHLTAILRPIPSRFKDTDLGSNINYVVEIKNADGSRKMVPIGKNDHDIRIFRAFELTPESLESKELLELFLLEKQIEGVLVCRDLEVHSVEVWRHDLKERYSKEFSITKDSFFRYHILGKISTLLHAMHLRAKNRAARKAARKR